MEAGSIRTMAASAIRYDLDEDLDLPDHPEICGLAQDFLEQFLIKAVQLVDELWLEISAVASRLIRCDLLAENDVVAIVHTATAISKTNAAAAIAAKHRSTESNLSVSPPVWTNIRGLPNHGAALRRLRRER